MKQHCLAEGQNTTVRVELRTDVWFVVLAFVLALVLWSGCFSPAGGDDFFRVKMLNLRSISAEIFRVAPDEELL